MVEHHKECFTKEECANYFSRLLEDVPWEYVTWKTGRKLPRQTFRYPDGYEVPVLETLAAEVREMFECNVESAWCNLYRDGTEYTPPHQDRYGKHVITLSFGATRKCVTEEILTGKKTEYLLEDGDVFLFPPAFDARHRHSVPKASKKIGERISVVFFTDEPYSLSRAELRLPGRKLFRLAAPVVLPVERPSSSSGGGNGGHTNLTRILGDNFLSDFMDSDLVVNGVVSEGNEQIREILAQVEQSLSGINWAQIDELGVFDSDDSDE